MGFVGPVINGLRLTWISEIKLVTSTPVSQRRNCLDTVFLMEQFWDLFCFCYILLRFLKTRQFWSSNANWHLRFSLGSIFLEDRNRSLLECIQKFMVCDLRILRIRFVCFSVSKFVACDRNYDWRQQKTHLWRQLLNFRVRRVFLKSAVILRLTKLSNVSINKKDVRRWYQLYVC